MEEQMEKETVLNTQFREQLEQERRDHELALRLAQETNGQVEDLSPPTRRLTGVQVINSASNSKLTRYLQC
ncbi:Unconventional myosin-VI [Homalodisca vitripennis]|nr:Unconventional myosin-VI [Homalodisca vitripennis]